MGHKLEIYDPPKPNWKITMRDSEFTVFHLRFERGPNAVQRFFLARILGLRFERIKG